MVGPKTFLTLQTAYDDAATTNGSVIKLLEGTLSGSFTATRGIDVKLAGGLNAAYNAISSETTLHGPVKLQGGVVRMQGGWMR